MSKTLPFYLKTNIEALAKKQAENYFELIVPALSPEEIIDISNKLKYDHTYFGAHLDTFIDMDIFRQVVSNVINKARNGTYADYIDDIKTILQNAYAQTLLPKLESLQESFRSRGKITLCDSMFSFLENF